MPKLGRILCVWPHADDGAFNAAATVADAIRNGSEVKSVVISDSAGSGNASAQLRETEERASGKLIGLRDIEFLGFPDGEIQLDHHREKIVHKLAEIIREFKPDTIITYDEHGGLTGHPDHVATGNHVKAALHSSHHTVLLMQVAITGPWLKHVMPPLRGLAQAIWDSGSLKAIPEPELFIDRHLTGDDLESKLQAVWTHASQIEPLVGKIEPAGGEDLLIEYWFSREAFRATKFP